MESEAAPIRNWPVRVLVALALIAGLFAADVGLGYRKLVAGNAGESLDGVHEPHGSLGWSLEPNARGTHVRPGNFSVVYGVDDHGLRQVTNRGLAESRLWLFGDSFTFGHGVADADAYPSVMAREWLVAGIHVVNGGVMGYGISQQLQLLMEVMPRIERGDIVVFAPTSIDVERSFKHFRYPSRHLFRRSKGHIERFPNLENGRLVAAELDTSANRIRALFYHSRFTGRGVQRIYEAFWPADHIAEARQMVGMAREIAEQRGARFALLFLPQPKECLSDGYRVDLSSFVFPDLKGYFPDEAEGVDAIRFPDDPHWNERGHAMAARAVVGALLSEGVLEPADVTAIPGVPARGRRREVAGGG